MNIELLEMHYGDKGLQLGSEEDCYRATGLTLKQLHPFLENYLWKVLDESIFENEKIFLYAGKEGEVLEIEANALKYAVGVINGLLAPVCE